MREICFLCDTLKFLFLCSWRRSIDEALRLASKSRAMKPALVKKPPRDDKPLACVVADACRLARANIIIALVKCPIMAIES